jgi:hypothetical protein
VLLEADGYEFKTLAIKINTVILRGVEEPSLFFSEY